MYVGQRSRVYNCAEHIGYALFVDAFLFLLDQNNILFTLSFFCCSINNSDKRSDC